MASRRPSKTAGPIERVITPDLVRDALSCIPADVDRDTWARVGMAVKASDLGDQTAFDLFDEWSARGASYKAKDSRDAWKSFKAGGPVRVNTLFGIAKDHGFRFPEADTSPDGTRADARTVQAAEDLAAQRAKRAEDEARALAEQHDAAAAKAAALWAQAADSGESAYLVRKGVKAHGVRFLADGRLVVPLRDRAGRLWNVQTIEPEKPADDEPEKRFTKGGRKSGLWHWCGEPAGAAVLLVAEGYATAATIHEATGRPVAVAFDAGNLAHVVRELRSAWPAVPLLVCGDDDRATEERTGKNTGRDKAAAAARVGHSKAAPAHMVFPEGLPKADLAASDFNDLAKLAGPGRVRELVEAACTQILASGAAQPAGKVQASPARPAGAVSDSAPGGRRPGAADDAPEGAQAERYDAFSVSDSGVWFKARDKDGSAKKPVWLCARLVVAARTRADDANGWGSLLEFSDPDGNAKSWAMPSAMLSGEGAEWAGRLRDMGLRMAPGTQARTLIAQYIDTRDPAERVTCTDRVGWHPGGVYVLPSSCITGAGHGEEGGKRYVFQSDSRMEDTFRKHGSLVEWQSSVAGLAAGNSRLVFAICCALAGPVLRLAGMESGGFHFRGDSSMGKTTALKIAASVWGRPSYMQRWRTTDNALEATAVQHCDGLLILDEFGQLDPKVAGECAYMLANDQEKGRATRGGQARKRRTWRLLFLSSGEVSLADHMAEAGKRTRAGMEVRMVDVPLDAGAGMGGIEALHDHEGAGALADAITAAAARCYGSAGRAWLEWLCDHHGELPQRLLDLVDRYRGDIVPEAGSEQVRRIGSRFALVAAAGELATSAGVTGWAEGEALGAARRCFASWLGARGHLDNGEDAAMLRQVRRFLELNGEGRFTWWHRAVDDHAVKTLNRAGFRRLLGEDGKPVKSDSDHQREYGDRISASAAAAAQVDYVVLREVFQRELCQGFDAVAVAKLLKARGHLVHETDRLTAKQRLPGIGMASCYHIKPSIFDDDL